MATSGPGHRLIAGPISLLLTSGLLLLAETTPAAVQQPQEEPQRLALGYMGDFVLSPDGRFVATTTWARDFGPLYSRVDSVRIWDLSSPEPRQVRAIPGNLPAGFSAHSAVIAVAGSENRIRVAEVETGRELQVFQQETWPRDIVVNPDGTVVASIDGAQVHLWSVSTGNRTLTLDAYEEPLHLDKVVRFSPDGALLATGQRDREAVQIWDLETGSRLLSLPGHSGGLGTLAFSPDGRWLATAEPTGTNPEIRLWELPSGRHISTLVDPRIDPNANQPTRIDYMGFSPDSHWLMVSVWRRNEFGYGSTESLDLWEVSSGQRRTAIEVSGLHVHSPETNRWASVEEVGNNKTLVLHDAFSDLDAFVREIRAEEVDVEARLTDRCLTRAGMEATAQVPELLIQAGHPDESPSTALSPDGCLLATGSEVHLLLWDVLTGRKLRQWSATARRDAGYDSDPVRFGGLAFSPDGQSLAACTYDNGYWQVRIKDVATGEDLWSSQTGEGLCGGDLVFSPDGRWLVMDWLNDSRRPMEVWDLSDGSKLDIQAGRANGRWYSFALSPDSRWLALGLDSRVELRSLDGARSMRSLDGFQSLVTGLGFSPDGRLLAVGDGRSVDVVEVESGEVVESFVDTREIGDCPIAWNPAGTRLAFCAGETVEVWDLAEKSRLDSFAEYDPDYVALTAQDELVARDGRSLQWWKIGLEEDPVTYRSAITRHLFSADFGLLAARSPVADALLIDTRRGLEIKHIGTSRPLVSRVAFSPNGQQLTLLTQNNVVRSWDTNGGILAYVANAETESDALYSADGRWLALTGSLGSTPNTTLLNAVTGRHVMTVEAGFLGFSPDDRWLALADGNDLRLWDLERGQEGPRLRGVGELEAAAFDPNMQWFAAWTVHGLIAIWEADTWTEVSRTTSVYDRLSTPDGRWRLEPFGVERMKEASTGRVVLPNRHGVGGLPYSYSPDGQWVATPTGQTELQILEVSTQDTVAVIQPQVFSYGGSNPIDGALFGSTGDRLALFGRFGVILWNLTTGEELRHSGSQGWLTGLGQLDFCPNGTCLALVGEESSLHLWDAATGEGLAQVVPMGDGADWVVITPDGLFDGTPLGIQELVAWSFGTTTAPLEIYFNEFFYPGLLAELIAGRRPEAPRDISELDRRQPQVTLSSGAARAEGVSVSERFVEVEVHVEEIPAGSGSTAGSGAQDVRLFRNGSLVRAWRGDVLGGGSGTTLEATVPIVAGVNRFTAYAFNHDNIKSTDATLTVTGDESLERTGTAYILAVGINSYANPDYNLTYAVPDARVFGEELARQQAAIGTFDRVEVVPLLDQDATKANILAALARLAGAEVTDGPPELARLTKAEPEDAVFVYYAGHGTAAGPRFYLIPHDLGYQGGRQELDEAAVETILSHSISDEELERAFEPIDAGHLLLVIDACNSGQALEAEEKRRGPMNSKGLAQLAYEKGMYVLAAAQGYQAALEVAELGHGLLTYALVEEGLKTDEADAAPTDGEVVMREWLDFAGVRVPQLQMGAMEEARQAGREVAFVDGEEVLEQLTRRSLQRPRLFYRREPETRPLVVAQTATGTGGS